MTRIPFMSRARGARLILDANLARQAAQCAKPAETVCPACGRTLTLRPGAPLPAHFSPDMAPCYGAPKQER